MTVKIAIIDDHEMLRQGIASMLPEDFRIILSSGNLDDLLMSKKSFDVIILDLNLAQLPGAMVIEKVLQFIPDAKIVVYSMRDSIEAISACYAARSKAFVSKGSPGKHLLDAVNKVLDGKIYYEPGVAEDLATYQLTQDQYNPTKVLSEKDLEIFKLRAQGVPAIEIAEQLDATPKNIYNRITIIQERLNINKDDFPQVARRYGLISDD